MPQARTRNSRAGSCDPSTELSLRVRAEQDDPSIRLDRPETKDLRHERTDLARRKVRDRDDRPTDQIVAVVPRLDCDDLIGRPVVAVTNFPSRQIGPFMSEVLCLGAVQTDRRVILLRPDSEGELGARIA